MEITVVFSGHNIASFAKLAISSFKYYHPDITNIVYFDDISTDNTAHVLKDLGVKVIGWKPEYLNMYNSLNSSGILSTGMHRLVVRCEFIFKQILEFVSTPTLILLDGDTVVLSPFNQDYFTEYTTVISATKNVLGDYSKHINNPLLSHYTRNIINDGYMRVHPYCCILNLNNLQIKSLSDNLLNRDYIRILDGTICDVGSDVWNMLSTNNSKVNVSRFENVLHWGWISSSRRDTKMDGAVSHRDTASMILKLIAENRDLRRMLKICKVTYKDLVDVLNTTRSDY